MFLRYFRFTAQHFDLSALLLLFEFILICFNYYIFVMPGSVNATGGYDVSGSKVSKVVGKALGLTGKVREPQREFFEFEIKIFIAS